jgi:hypothetical protein
MSISQIGNVRRDEPRMLSFTRWIRFNVTTLGRFEWPTDEISLDEVGRLIGRFADLFSGAVELTVEIELSVRLRRAFARSKATVGAA